MDIFFHCDKCGHGISIDESCAGLVMKCGHCAASLTIPSHVDQALETDAFAAASATSTMTAVATTAAPTVTCPFCIESSRKGHHVCPVCGGELHASHHRRMTRLGIANATLVVLIIAIGWYAITHWQNRKGGSAMQAASRATANSALPGNGSEPMGQAAFAKAATSLMTSLHEVELAIKAKAERDKYVETLGAVTARLDELLRVADETGLYKSDPGARDFCSKVSSIFLSYNQALEQWELELLLRSNKETAKRAHESVVETATDKAIVDKSLQETTDTLNDLTAKVMKAMENRYDLWLGAEKEIQAAAGILVRFRE